MKDAITYVQSSSTLVTASLSRLGQGRFWSSVHFPAQKLFVLAESNKTKTLTPTEHKAQATVDFAAALLGRVIIATASEEEIMVSSFLAIRS